SPQANITMMATWVNPAIHELLAQGDFKVRIVEKPFEAADIEGHDLVIAATNFRELNQEIRHAAKREGKLVNVADTPDLCDFYLGSIVTRGPLKVAISTNGQSPTFAKRFRQLLESILPEEVEDLIQNLKLYRDQLEGDFEAKVKQLNDVTASLVEGSAGDD
ncbi:MAG: bifunctional precorrin-2 dehydrogenase/sirohydrochlorin ferrochelatase, partial [Bacteroidota bacterium]